MNKWIFSACAAAVFGGVGNEASQLCSTAVGGGNHRDAAGEFDWVTATLFEND